MSHLHCVISNLRTLSGWRSCLKCINIMRNILMLVIFWHIDSHKASCSKMNCSPVPGCENGAVVGFCLLFVWAQIVFTFPPQLTLSWLSCRRSWGKRSWWWRTLFPTLTTVPTGGCVTYWGTISPSASSLSCSRQEWRVRWSSFVYLLI